MSLRSKKIKAIKSEISKIPENSGVYIFWNDFTPIYIGKAINLRMRLTSYFATTLLEKTRQMISEALEITYIEVPSEIEALLLEAELVWKYKPKFNVSLKDDKHPLYIMITKEKYPRVLAAKRTDLDLPHLKIYGPFPSTYNMKYVLRMLRPIFRYSNHKLGSRPCLYSQMGLCDPCPGLIEQTKGPEQKILMQKYKQNLKGLNGVLGGRIKSVRKNLAKLMEKLSKEEKFEEALEVKEKIARLDYITSPRRDVSGFVENPHLLQDLRSRELKQLRGILLEYFPKLKTSRIECFDIAHLAGSSPTASMVTFSDGEADKSLYRHFKIKQIKGNDDISSLTEVAKRRERWLKEWGRPDLIIVDGGKGQTKVFWEVFSKYQIPVVGIAKRYETLVIPVPGKKLDYVMIRLKGPALSLVQRLRDEAHRFARRYHHKLLKNYLLASASGVQ